MKLRLKLVTDPSHVHRVELPGTDATYGELAQALTAAVPAISSVPVNALQLSLNKKDLLQPGPSLRALGICSGDIVWVLNAVMPTAGSTPAPAASSPLFTSIPAALAVQAPNPACATSAPSSSPQFRSLAAAEARLQAGAAATGSPPVGACTRSAEAENGSALASKKARAAAGDGSGSNTSAVGTTGTTYNMDGVAEIQADTDMDASTNESMGLLAPDALLRILTAVASMHGAGYAPAAQASHAEVPCMTGAQALLLVVHAAMKECGLAVCQGPESATAYPALPSSLLSGRSPYRLQYTLAALLDGETSPAVAVPTCRAAPDATDTASATAGISAMETDMVDMGAAVASLATAGTAGISAVDVDMRNTAISLPRVTLLAVEMGGYLILHAAVAAAEVSKEGPAVAAAGVPGAAAVAAGAAANSTGSAAAGAGAASVGAAPAPTGASPGVISTVAAANSNVGVVGGAQGSHVKGANSRATSSSGGSSITLKLPIAAHVDVSSLADVSANSTGRAAVAGTGAAETSPAPAAAAKKAAVAPAIMGAPETSSGSAAAASMAGKASASMGAAVSAIVQLYKDLPGLWRTVKDGLALKLLSLAHEAAGLPPPLGLTVLPIELCELVLQLLPATDLASVSCTCSQLRHLASTDRYWKAFYLQHVNVVRRSDEERAARIGWKAVYGAWAALNKEIRRQRQQKRSPMFSGPRPYPMTGGPVMRTPIMPPHIIGGDYDRFPQLPGFSGGFGGGSHIPGLGPHGQFHGSGGGRGAGGGLQISGVGSGHGAGLGVHGAGSLGYTGVIPPNGMSGMGGGLGAMQSMQGGQGMGLGLGMGGGLPGLGASGLGGVPPGMGGSAFPGGRGLLGRGGARQGHFTFH